MLEHNLCSVVAIKMVEVGLLNTENSMTSNFFPVIGQGRSSYSELISGISNSEKQSFLLSSIDYIKEDKYYCIERFKSCLERIKDTKHYDFIMNYIYFYRTVKNWNIATCIRAINVYLKYQKYVDFDNLTIQSVFNLYMRVKTMSCSDASKSIDWRKLRQMIKFANFPYDTAEFKIQEPKNKIKPEDLLSKTEFNKILRELENHQYGKGLEYKTFLYIIADTGCRTSEVFSISKRNLILNDDNLFEVIVSGKTGERRVILYHSTELLKLLINGGWTKWTFDYYVYYRQLTRVCSRLGIEKRVYNHLLRHGFGSFIAEDNSVSLEIKNSYCGWSPKSRTLETTYAHFTQKKVINLMKPVLSRNPLFN